ncbi:unnamed protein product [Cuscuta europaea]|uniref:RNA polymerase sigma-70 domain-containing protein n=1 Tax=Cuscuta europaea TaxID=41803 RepID=A0A9P0ZPA6_CUSEU|nr:unnamed protein product [Cuscuta europaea]
MVVNVADIGLGAGKRLLSSAYSHSDVAEKLSCSCSVITAKNSPNYTLPFISNRRVCSIKAVKESTDFVLDTSNREPFDKRFSESIDESSSDEEDKVEAILLLQKSFLEKQWDISAEKMMTFMAKENKSEGVQITCSGTSARKRRIDSRKKVSECKNPLVLINKRGRSTSGKHVLRNHLRSYVKGVGSGELLTHAEVVQLSEKVKLDLYLEECRSRLKDRVGCEPTDEQFAISLRTSSADLQVTKMECHLAKEKLAMSNVRLVMSIAQRYDNMGAEMADLVQGGLIGLLRGIEKFDPSKGFKISTYVFWWIRLGVTKALAENSRVVRLPNHLHERLSLIRNAKKKLEEKGITPSIDRIAESLNISEQKVQNASEAIIKVFSLDREAFPSLNVHCR